jgi:hypothetical protein
LEPPADKEHVGRIIDGGEQAGIVCVVVLQDANAMLIAGSQNLLSKSCLLGSCDGGGQLATNAVNRSEIEFVGFQNRRC